LFVEFDNAKNEDWPDDVHEEAAVKLSRSDGRVSKGVH
jgi:hypothetical protein